MFRVEERKAARLNPLDRVRDRARDLWLRDQGEVAWTALVAKLRLATPVKIDESHFLPLVAVKQNNSTVPR